MKIKGIKFEKPILLILLLLFLLAISVAFVLFGRAKWPKNQPEMQTKDSGSNYSTGTNEDNQGSSEDKSPAEMKIVIKAPAPEDYVSVKRSISGTSINSGGKIYYEIIGHESGSVASGVINVNDAGNEQVFIQNFELSKKPNESEKGYVAISVDIAGKRSLYKKIEVNL